MLGFSPPPTIFNLRDLERFSIKETLRDAVLPSEGGLELDLASSNLLSTNELLEIVLMFLINLEAKPSSI